MPPNKSRNWTDVELIISSVSVALTLGFWGVFASRQKIGADVVGQVSLVPGAGNSLTTASAPPTVLAPGQTIFFGVSTPQPPAPLASQPQPRRRGGGGGGRGGGGGGGGAVASTKSS